MEAGKTPSSSLFKQRAAQDVSPLGERYIGHLLQADPDLGENMPADAYAQAEAAIRVEIFTIDKGSWEPPELDHGTIGVLLLSGLMIRRVRLGQSLASEIIGPGDIIRPWEDGLAPHLVPPSSEWKVLHQGEVALLDSRVTKLIGHWPELTAGVVKRVLRRTGSLHYVMAASNFVRTEDRLLATLWHLASLWGRMTAGGVLIPFRLTHEVLSEIIGAQRPTVSMAIKGLQDEGLLTQRDRHWVLLGDAPQWQVKRAQGTPAAD